MIQRLLLPGLLITTLVLLAVPASNAAAQSGSAAGFINQLDQKMSGVLRIYHVPGTALALIENGAVTWAKGYGLADVAAGASVTPDTVRSYAVDALCGMVGT